MRRVSWGPGNFALFLVLLFPSAGAFAQGPSTIQVFMPGGAMPNGVVRLTLAREDGFIDTVYTDSKGKYEIRTPGNPSSSTSSGASNLPSASTQGSTRYTVTIDGDKQSYDTTTTTFTVQRNSPAFVTVFLKPLTSKTPIVNSVLDVTTFEGDIPVPARAAYKHATEAVGKGELDEAIRNLQRAISLHPRYVSALNDLGVIFLRLNRLDEAAATFRQSIEISKRFFHPRLNLGIVLNRQQKHKEAAEILGKLYEENHGMLDVRLAYASALMGLGQLPESEKIYRSTLESHNLPAITKANVHFRLGVGLNRQGKFPEAVVELEKSLELNADAPNSHLQLGAALMQLQQSARAESELLRAYELAGKSAGGAQLLLGHMYYTQKRYPEAQRAFEQYLKDLPSAPNSSQISELVSNLKASMKN